MVDLTIMHSSHLLEDAEIHIFVGTINRGHSIKNIQMMGSLEFTIFLAVTMGQLERSKSKITDTAR